MTDAAPGVTGEFACGNRGTVRLAASVELRSMFEAIGHLSAIAADTSP